MPASPALSVAGVGLTIGGATILEGVDLDVASGGLVGVIGPNGPARPPCSTRSPE